MEYTFEIRFRRGTSSQWSAVNPVLSPGEPGYVTDLNTLKVGDGLTALESNSFCRPVMAEIVC